VTGYDTCTDCTAQRVDGDLVHNDTCPLGLGYDEIQADDRFWFALRPHEAERRRPAHWAEIAELRALGALPPGADVHGDVVVTRITDGIRAKRFDETYFVVRVPGIRP
jgi:hypothetical protein